LNYAPTDGDSLIFAGTTRLTNTNNTLTGIGSITFNSGAGAFMLSGNALTVSGGITNNAANAQTVGMNLSLSAAQQFNAASGDLTVSGAVANGGNLLTVTGSSNTTLSNAVSGAGGLTKTSSGLLTMSGNSSYSGGTTVNGTGTLRGTNLHALGTGGLAINNSATMQFQGNLGTVVLPSVNLNNNSLTPTATFDIDQNSVVIPYVSASPFATIRKQVMYGANNGTGIISSTADGSTTAVGYAEASELGIDGGGNYLNHQPTNTNTAIPDEAVILKYTYVGDFNLDGNVSNSDFILWNGNNGTTDGTADWNQGDANFDGNVTQSDFILWNGNNGSTGLSGGGGGPVPEPSTLVLAALGMAGLAAVACRRRRAV
jgi:autotransporter-associated beta strand protein